MKFKEQHGCKLNCVMGDKIIPLFRDAYTDITHEEVKPERYYATYNMGLFFDDKDCIHQPCDFRLCPRRAGGMTVLSAHRRGRRTASNTQ